jgi:TetR/AcrR family transcriptional repressor of nem operon
MPTPAPRRRAEDARAKLLDAALTVIRRRGYAATSVEELCAAAGVTKGAFFHHFASKEALAVAAAAHWSETTAKLFAAAPYHAPADPLARALAYLDFRAALIEGAPEAFTCLAGTMLQETYQTAPAIGAASYAAIADHAATLEADLAAAIARRGLGDTVSARGLALHSQAVLQGAFILAKGSGDPALARESVAHLRRYLELLLGEQPGGTA